MVFYLKKHHAGAKDRIADCLHPFLGGL
jgi:hypothetical protein